MRAEPGQWRYTLMTDKLSAATQIAERVYSLAHEQDDAALMIEGCRALAVTLYCSGDFETAQQYAMRAVQIWRSGSARSHAEDLVYFLTVGAINRGWARSASGNTAEGIAWAAALDRKTESFVRSRCSR